MLRIMRIHQFLTKLDICSTTLGLGGQNFVTGSIVFPVVASLKKLLKIDSEDAVYIAHMKEVVLDDFKQRIADNLNGDVLLKCTALDPRFKSMKIVENKEAREAIFKKLKKDPKETASGTEEAVSSRHFRCQNGGKGEVRWGHFYVFTLLHVSENSEHFCFWLYLGWKKINYFHGWGVPLRGKFRENN